VRWLAKLVSKRAVSLALIAAVVTVDHTVPWQGMSFVPRALVDEPCAVATALVVLDAITRFRGTPPNTKLGWSMLAWSVLIDIDHLPLEFGFPVLTEGTHRPYFHALGSGGPHCGRGCHAPLVQACWKACISGRGEPARGRGLRNIRALPQGCSHCSDAAVVAGYQS
jgi:hypothetical protein